MRKPDYRHRGVRPRQVNVPSGTNLEELAARVSYVGSPEHKSGHDSFAGAPRPRADASVYPARYKQAAARKWLREAVRKGNVAGFGLDAGPFPRYAWHEEDGIVFEGRLVNAGKGEYKGYPLNEDEKVRGLR